MKAKAGLLTLLILLVGFAGFGQTTSDPVQNSTAEVHSLTDMVSVEAPVSVVTAEFTVVVLQNEAGTEGAFVSGSEKVDEAYFITTSQFEGEAINLTKEDLKVGWQLRNESKPHNYLHLIRQSKKDPGGVLSLFYI